MKKLNFKYGKYIIITLVLLVAAVVCKLQVAASEKDAGKIPANIGNKEIVTLWLRQAEDTETRKYQVEKFNKSNKDVFIDIKIYNEDYFNLLRISLAADKKADIFQYGYYELLKNDNYLNLDNLGIDSLNINPKNFLNFDGKKVGIKTSGNDVKMAWNKEIFKQAGLNPENPPKTWKEVEDYAKIIKEKCPNVVPFEFPSNTWGELKSSIGEVAGTQGTVYTTFWNYKTGKYDFSYAKDILNVFKDMYAEGLTGKSLPSTGSIDMRRDFYYKKTAMIISNYEDRNYFSTVVPIGFSFGISDIPLLNLNDKANYFYTENYKCFIVNKNITNKTAVKTVLAWLVSNETNQELFYTGKVLPSVGGNLTNKNDAVAAYGDSKNFQQEELDPTIYTNYKPDFSRDLFIDAITGKKSVEDVINLLNTQYDQYVNFMKKADNLDFTKYIIKN